jgi:hypothetical protein
MTIALPKAMMIPLQNAINSPTIPIRRLAHVKVLAASLRCRAGRGNASALLLAEPLPLG